MAARLVLAVMLALGLAPGALAAMRPAAYAAQGAFTVDRQHNPYIAINGTAYYEATVDGTTYAVYCNDPWAPEGPLGTYYLTDIQQGTPRQDYIVAKGYPNTNYIGGESWDDIDALQITQMAAWIDGDPSIGYDYMVEQTQRFGGAGVPRNLYDAAAALFAEANSYGGGDPSIDGAAMTAISDQHAQGAQQILMANLRPVGNIEVAKVSSNAEMTEGNPCYHLNGAEFSVADSSGAIVGTIVTGADGKGCLNDLKTGSYTVTETKAPEGYALDSSPRSIQVEPGETSSIEFSDTPIADLQITRVGKVDANLGDATPQGSAHMDGAEFSFRFYPGYYSSPSELPSSPARTWVMKTDAKGGASPFDGKAKKASGSNFYLNATGKVAVPLGTVTIEETKAPEGYVLDNGSGSSPKLFMLHIKARAGSNEAIVDPVNYGADEASLSSGTPLASDTVKRGNVELEKTDSATRDGKAQGSATLAGAEFEVVNTSERPVVSPQTGQLTNRGEVVCTIVTDVNGHASTTNEEANGWSIPAELRGKALAYGTYSIRETKAPKGYLMNSTWHETITISDDEQIVKYSLSDDVKRGDFEFDKVDGTTMKRLRGIPFLITSKTTGESHVIVSDENGMVSTNSNWNAHTTNTNASDQALSKNDSGYEIDESKLDPGAGIWFYGHAESDTGAPVTNALGALPYDTYTVEELRCNSNANLALASFEVIISRHDRSLNLGTIDDNPAPSIGTTLLDDQGTHTLAAGKTLVVTDEIAYSNFEEGDYVFTGELHALDERGQDAGVVATGTKEAHLASGSGTVAVAFELDTSDFVGSRLVAFERCLDSKGDVVASHEDLEDDYQTVSVPEVKTSLVDATDADREVDATAPICLTDTVSYSGLTPEKTYSMTMTLHYVGSDGDDAGIVCDANGDPVTATSQFTPTSSAGTVDVNATFEIADDGGYDMVAFEELSYRGSIYAVHADVTDEQQTVHVPEKPTQEEPEETPVSIGTTAADVTSGTHEGIAAQNVTIVDSVAYSGLESGRDYIVSGTLYDRDTNEPYVQPNGEIAATSVTFTAEAESGFVDVPFTVDGSELSGKQVVAFERIASADAPDQPLAVHEDITNTEQTVAYRIDNPNPKTPTESVKPSSKPSALPKTGDIIGAGAPILVMGIAFAAAAVAVLAHRKRQNGNGPTKRKALRK